MTGATTTRRSFLSSIISPLITQSAPTDLQSQLALILGTASRLNRLDIFSDVSASIAPADPSDPSTSPTDLAVTYAVKERSRLELKTGTDLGNTEGSAYVSGTARNLFGGDEGLQVNASLGTRVRSAYSAIYSQPIAANPDVRWELQGTAASSLKPWASHEEVLRGASSKLSWLSGGGLRHEFGYGFAWRQLTGLTPHASRTVREQAGDSVKSSVTHTCSRDTRDSATLATSGYMWKTVSEIAGWGPLRGDVAFWRSEVDASASARVPLPFLADPYALGLTVTQSLRAGLLYPMTLGGSSDSEQGPKPSSLADRFQLGGPTDVRGFRIGGLGPRDGADAVGGDLYAAGSVSVLAPLPRLGPEAPLRLQAFINGGRLLALRDLSGEVKRGGNYWGTQRCVLEALGRLAEGLPSCAAGVGLVYAGRGARVEVNVSLPLVLRQGEEGRKGLQVGIGISFL